MIKEWIDKRKVIHDLEKMFTLYYTQWSEIVKSLKYDDTDLEEQFEATDAIRDILYTISYILCHEFKREGKYKDCFWGYKFLIDEFYDKEFGKCVGNYRLIQEQARELDLIKPLKGKVTDKQYGIINDNDGKFNYDYVTTLQKGNTYYDIENNKCYMFDGKNLLEMC